ncbi:MAG: hypothetical protein V4674_02945 [Patescibacteria group bacterium]
MSHLKALFDEESYRLKQRLTSVIVGGVLGIPLIVVAFTFAGVSQNLLLFAILFMFTWIYVGVMQVFLYDDLFVPKDRARVRSFVKGAVLYGCVAGILFYLALLAAARFR